MSDHTEERIQLAEMVGWTQISAIGRRIYGINPKDKQDEPYDEMGWQDTCLTIPNPYTDANHCEALILHLVATGWRVEMDFPSFDLTEISVRLYSEKLEYEWHGYAPIENWKQGVCELALALKETTK